MNRTIKDATVKRYHYGSHDELRHHLQLFVEAYNYGRRLETLRGLNPARIHLPSLDQAARTVQPRSVTPHAGTEHLEASLKGSQSTVVVYRYGSR